MARASQRFQPCDLEDGEHFSLLRFAHMAAHTLDPNFNPPTELHAEDSPASMESVMHFTKRWGSAEQGFETVHIAELEPRASATVTDRLKLKAIGLAPGCSLEMETAREWQDPRYIEITVEGSGAAIGQIIAKFNQTFGGSQMETEKLEQALTGAEDAIRVGDWDAALGQAQTLIDLDPGQPDAYFIQGASYMAKNELAAAVTSLQKAIELQPDHLHAQLNLGMVYFRQGNFEAAQGALKDALAIDPQQPEALLHLAWAAERQGDAMSALDAYQRLMEAPVDPSGKDYVTLAVEGVGRVSGSIGGNG